MSFMNLFKILNDCSTIWAALYCSPCEYFHFARFMFCHQSLHKPIVIIQIKPDIQYILTFCIRAEYHTFGIRTQVCDAGNTSCWIFNWCWTCAQQLSLGIFFAQILWWRWERFGKKEQCSCDDGSSKGWRGTIFTLPPNTSENIKQNLLTWSSFKHPKLFPLSTWNTQTSA